MNEKNLASLERETDIGIPERYISEIVASCRKKKQISICHLKDQPIETYAAFDVEGETITTGFGKGVHAHIGAFGECMEHLHTWFMAQEIDKLEVHISGNEIFQNDIFTQTGCRMLDHDEKVRAIKHKTLCSHHDAYLPLSLINFYFPADTGGTNAERFFGRYSSSSGTAFGFSIGEAMLHAILEVLERHEISRVFLSILGYEHPAPDYLLVTDYSFNSEIEMAAKQLAEVHKVNKIQSIVRQGPYDTIFSFTIASVKFSNKILNIWGAGCSLYRDLAIYRSITECIQMVAGNAIGFNRKVEPIAKKYPALKALRHLDITNLTLKEEGLRIEAPVLLSVDEQLQALKQRIGAAGQEVLYFEHPSILPCYAVVSAYITNTEKFFNVWHSVPALPISYLKAIQ